MPRRKKVEKTYDYSPGCYERDKVKSFNKSEDSYAVEDWLNFSMSNHSESEIRSRILTNIDSICFTYVCRYSRLSEKFIYELIGLSTGLFDWSNYDFKQCINISRLCMEDPKRRKKIVEAIMYKYYPDQVKFDREIIRKQINQAKKDGKTISLTLDPIIEIPEEYRDVDPKLFIGSNGIIYNFRDKIDWYYIDRYQILSDDFKEVFSSVIKSAKNAVQNNETTDYDD